MQQQQIKNGKKGKKTAKPFCRGEWEKNNNKQWAEEWAVEQI